MCWSVLSSDADSLLMYPFGTHRYFALYAY